MSRYIVLERGAKHPILKMFFFDKTIQHILKEQQFYNQALNRGANYITVLKRDPHTYKRQQNEAGKGHLSGLQSAAAVAEELTGVDHQRHRRPTGPR